AAVEEDAALLRIVKAEQERGDGRFSGAAGADERDDLPLPGGEAEVFQDGDFGAGGVGEGDVVERDFTAEAGRRDGRAALFEDLGRFTEEFADALGRA